jgi:hypothetical protein
MSDEQQRHSEVEIYGRELTPDERDRFRAMYRELNTLAKWRQVFAGWQLGTRLASDPECQAVRDAAENRLMVRAELTAVALLLVKKGVVTPSEYFDAVATEARLLSEQLETRFPGFRASEVGMHMDVPVAAETTKGWPR